MTFKIVDPNDTLGVLKAAAEWLSDESHWQRNNYWNAVNRENVTATCLYGALAYVSGGLHGGDSPPMADVALEDGFREMGLELPAALNDDEGYEAVMSGLKKVIEKLESS
jgi:hypothetical protein